MHEGASEVVKNFDHGLVPFAEETSAIDQNVGIILDNGRIAMLDFETPLAGFHVPCRRDNFCVALDRPVNIVLRRCPLYVSPNFWARCVEV